MFCCGVVVVGWTLIASIRSFCFSGNDQKSSETKATESQKLSGTNERSSYGSADDGELRIPMVSQSTNRKPKSKPKPRHSLMGDAQVMDNVLDKATIGFLGSAELGWNWIGCNLLTWLTVMLTLDFGFGIGSMLKLIATDDDKTVNCPACQVLWIQSASSLAIWPYGLLYMWTYFRRVCIR